MRCSRSVWNALLTASTDLDAALADGDLHLDGDSETARLALGALDHSAFERADQ
jgi:hypothetical protein